jgi:beta-glucosidase
MDRVVEAGDFKIMVGGKSPSYKAQDRIKDSVGFEKAADGVNTTITYPYSFAADFDIAFAGMGEDLVHNTKTVSVKIQNNGTITDAGKVHLFVDGVQVEEVHHYELAPGEAKLIQFELPAAYRVLTWTTKYKTITM